MSTERTLESFDKKDLIEFIKKSPRFFTAGGERTIRDLSWIEYNRKYKELTTKLDVLDAELAGCLLPQGWGKYTELSDQWGAVSRALSRLFKGVA